MINVYDLRTGEVVVRYSGISDKEAVISAYAQLDRKDYNTWNYLNKYSGLVQYGKCTIACMDYCVKRNLNQLKNNVNNNTSPADVKIRG